MASIYMANGQLSVHRDGMRLLLDCFQGALCDAGPTGPDLFIKLFQNDYVPVCDSQPADFDEADFSGYAQVVINSGDPCTDLLEFGLNETGLWSMFLDQQVFTQSGTGVTNLVYGIYAVATITGDPKELVLFSLRFANGPFAMDETGNIIKASGNMPLECQMVPVTP